MVVVSKSQLKASLRRYLLRVQAGEEIMVTDRGRFVAKVVPFAVAPGSSTTLAELARTGQVRLPKTRLPRALLSRRPRARDPRGTVCAAVIAERAAGC